VPAILAQVRGDSVSARVEADSRGFSRTRLDASARLSHRRDMIDVYIKALMSCWHFDRPLGSQTIRGIEA
jgi:hypothetical protein